MLVLLLGQNFPDLHSCWGGSDMKISQMKHKFSNKSSLAASRWCGRQNSDGVPKEHLCGGSRAVLKAGLLLYSIYNKILQGYIKYQLYNAYHSILFLSVIPVPVLWICVVCCFGYHCYPSEVTSSVLPSHFHTNKKRHLRLKSNQSLSSANALSNWAWPWTWPCHLVSISAALAVWGAKKSMEIRFLLIYLCLIIPYFTWPSNGMVICRWIHCGRAPLRCTQGAGMCSTRSGLNWMALGQGWGCGGGLSCLL